jgi:hypothetical protein
MVYKVKLLHPELLSSLSLLILRFARNFIARKFAIQIRTGLLELQTLYTLMAPHEKLDDWVQRVVNGLL